MRLLAPLLISTLTALTVGCSPVVQVEATIAVSDTLAEARTGNERGAVVVLDDATGRERLVGVVCGPLGHDQLFSYKGTHAGCAFEADVSAALVPVDTSWECGAAYDDWDGGVPEDSPLATATVFEGQSETCRDTLERIQLRLE
jgi:hypothetical protein